MACPKQQASVPVRPLGQFDGVSGISSQAGPFTLGDIEGGAKGGTVLVGYVCAMVERDDDGLLGEYDRVRR